MAQNSTFLLELISPEGIIFNDQVDYVSIPTMLGEITVLPHHTPLFTKLDEGEVRIKQGGKILTIVVSGGFLEIKSGSAHILSDYAVRAESIETAKAEEKKRLAEDKLKNKLSNEEFTMADKELKLSILELKVAQKMRRRSQ